jgi:hypothetical protein
MFYKKAKVKIIDNPEDWFDFQEMRNLSSRVYDKTQADIIVEHFDLFSKSLETLIYNLQKKIDE